MSTLLMLIIQLLSALPGLIQIIKDIIAAIRGLKDPKAQEMFTARLHDAVAAHDRPRLEKLREEIQDFVRINQK